MTSCVKIFYHTLVPVRVSWWLSSRQKLIEKVYDCRHKLDMQLVPTKWQIHGLPSTPEFDECIPSRALVTLDRIIKNPKLYSITHMIYRAYGILKIIVLLMSCWARPDLKTRINQLISFVMSGSYMVPG